MKPLRKLWAGWKAFALWLGKVQTALLLTLIYHLTIGPIGLIGRLLRRDLMGLRRSENTSWWTPLPGATSTMDKARKQF